MGLKVRRCRRANLKFLINKGMQIVTILSFMESPYCCRNTVYFVSGVGVSLVLGQPQRLKEKIKETEV